MYVWSWLHRTVSNKLTFDLCFILIVFFTFQSTLRSIFNNIQPEDESDTLVVIFIAETDINFVKETANSIKVSFAPQLESGILEVISPPLEYYPEWSNLKRTLGKLILWSYFLWEYLNPFTHCRNSVDKNELLEQLQLDSEVLEIKFDKWYTYKFQVIKC